ncbi:cyanophycinase [Deinococcus cellulosilyticus]|uniref:Cyanophycinase n=1 Tax=Deinococcus cellulosilyticus (strain DSM 18568 / NBRC 106333 / KACC 11606 / 5516J-15) TaxID=1223518 RepID=A0A511N0Y2_DEIC1|nr:cyanophycinase [Deinococcus cellulosilyticus]GEM46108.1 cyanophycinase [Deinococcus cellulosilyticus NBRC 106333 = KACC 11606]
MPDHKRRKEDRVGTLIIIGGHEDKEGDREILQEVARRVGKGKLVVTTVASHEPEGYFDTYRKVFKDLGLKNVMGLDVNERADAVTEETGKLLEDARGIFFTGGDQLRITSQIGDTQMEARIREIFASGGVICGTSAGASVMCETMMIEGKGGESHRIGDLRMAPGLGLIRDAIIDQHFAERGRMGRLLGAVAQNPRVLGIGIDEDTTIVVEELRYFTVLGSGAVYVVDGSCVTHSNIAEGGEDQILSIYDVKLHVLSKGDAFDLQERRPLDACKLDPGSKAQDSSPIPEIENPRAASAASD